MSRATDIRALGSLPGFLLAVACAAPDVSTAGREAPLEGEILAGRQGPAAGGWWPAAPAGIGPEGAARVVALARLDDEVITTAEVFPHLFLSAHERVVESVKQTLIQRLVRKEEARLGWSLDEGLLEEQLEVVFDEQSRQVQALTKGAQSLEEYVEQTYRIPLERFKAWVRADVGATMMAHRLVVLTLMQEDRVQFRIIQVKTQAMAEQILDKLRRGADFAVLAREHSEDAAAPEGGLYPALPLSLDYPLVQRTRDLDVGEFDEIREVQTREGPRFRILQLMARVPADQGTALEQRERVEKELQGRSISALELDAWMRIMERTHAIEILPVGFL